MSDEKQTPPDGSFESFWEETKEPGQQLEDLPKLEPNEAPRSQAEEVTLGTHEAMFTELEQQCRAALASLTFQDSRDYDEVKAEVSRGRMEFAEDPSIHELSRQIGVVQVMKDRLIEIYAEAHRNWTVRKRITECLFDAYLAVSKEKSVDKRRGEANLRLAEYQIMQAEAEAFYHYCKQIVENLESQHRTVSRRIACAQMQMAIGELKTDYTDLKIPSPKDVKEMIEDTENSGKTPGTVDWGDM